MTEIKPCPRCGSTSQLFHVINGFYGYHIYRVDCTKCGLMGPAGIGYGAKAQAIEKWNKMEAEE